MSIFNTKLTPARALICGIALLVIACGRSLPALPLLVKVFVPFPSLEDATLYEGRVEVVGRMHATRNGMVPASYFVVSDKVRQEVWCGYPGDTTLCFGSDTLSNGAYGKVWFHSIYGVLQWDLTQSYETVRGQREASPISAYRWVFNNHFPYPRYYWPLAQSLAFLVAALYFFAKFKKLLNAKAAQSNLQ